jgi:ABC-type sugar transport system substrate-binding protein
MWLNSAQHGAIAIQALHDAVANGKPLPEKTFSEPELINTANFDQYKGKLCQS